MRLGKDTNSSSFPVVETAQDSAVNLLSRGREILLSCI